jgi:hypothetical protein
MDSGHQQARKDIRVAAIVHCRGALEVVRGDTNAIGHSPHHVLILGRTHGGVGHDHALVPLVVVHLGEVLEGPLALLNLQSKTSRTRV